jgi:hypothetical protein
MALRVSSVGRHAVSEIERGIGLMAWVTRSGPAARRSSLDDVLRLAGVMSEPPWRFVDSPVLDGMPWDGRRFPAPPPEPPAGIEGAWPQPPLLHPAFAAPVLNLEPSDRKEHLRYNVLRFLGQTITRSPMAALKARLGPRLIALDDERFGALVDGTSFAQFICPRLDAADHASFGRFVEGDPTSYAKVDTSAVDPNHRLPGVYVAPTVTLLRRDGDRYRPVAIRCGDRVLRPEDGDAWALARYFVLQGLQTLLVLVFHPRLHFPNDTINAVSRAMLPPRHVVWKLLRPHLDKCLGLHEATIHHRRSVFHNSQREIYTPFPFTTEGTHAAMVTGMRGIAGNSAYPPYRFAPALPGDHTVYGRYRRDWYEAYVRFFSRALHGVAPEDPAVTRWADHIHTWVPGFPSGREIRAEGALPAALATFVCAVSVFHTADHHSYARIPVEMLPWRLRQPPPGDPGPLDLDGLVSPEDSFRHRMCHRMFFAPVVIDALSDVRYGLRDGERRSAESAFWDEVRALDARWRGSGFPMSHEIATSPQY